MRTGLVIGAVALLAACGGSEEERGGVGGLQRVERESRWATPAEVEWLRGVSEWSARFTRAGRKVAAFEGGALFDRVVAGDASAIEAYRRVLAPIRRCGESFRRTVGPAPTRRLRESGRRFAESCAHYREGVRLILRALEQQSADLADEARAELESAGKDANVASGALPPGEKQELPVRGGVVAASRVEPRLSAAAGGVAGKDVEVRCWSAPDWQRLMVEERVYTDGRVDEGALGFASTGGARVNLAPPICDSLARFVYRGARPRGEAANELALALATLAHETVHVSGVADEPTAECHGIQRADDLAEGLGAPADYADGLQALYWGGYEWLPAAYRSPECRDGGELDLDESSTEFP